MTAATVYLCYTCRAVVPGPDAEALAEVVDQLVNALPSPYDERFTDQMIGMLDHPAHHSLSFSQDRMIFCASCVSSMLVKSFEIAPKRA